jgi:hypothetical protein
MAKKIHVSRIDPPVFDAKKFEIAGNLPTTEAVNQTIADVTGATSLQKPAAAEVTTETQEVKPPKVTKKTPSVKMAQKAEKKPIEKPKKEEKQERKETIERGRDARGALNRVGITALVDRDLLQKTKIWAVQNGLSMSDIVNDALSVYLKSIV